MQKVASAPPLIKSNIKLTIGILVSNHIKYIKKGMESIKPLLDSVPSELIVVDTVGAANSDGSLDVVKGYTDKIYHFDWINDFSAARNVAIDHAKGEWFMYFDDDEYFDDVTEIIDFFNSGECEKYMFALYYTGDYTKPGYMQKSVAGRMVRRTTNTRFTGIIHEGFNEAYLPVKQFNVFTHHFGYLYENYEQRRKKMERNLPLLEKEIAENGPNAKLCAQAVQELAVLEPEEAHKMCNRFIKELENTDELKTSGGQWMLLTKVRFMAGWGTLEGTLEAEKNMLEKYDLAETYRLMLAQQVAAVAYSNGNYAIAADRVKKYFEYYDWLMSHEEERIVQSQLDTSRFMMDSVLFMTTKIGIISENHLRHYDIAYSYIKRLDFRFCTDFDEIRKIIEYTLKEMDDHTSQIEYYKRFYRDELFNDPLLHKFLPQSVRVHLKTEEIQH